MSGYTAEDYINFIETGRRDKVSPHALSIIAERFRELEKKTDDYTKQPPSCPFWGKGGSCERFDKSGNCDGCNA